MAVLGTDALLERLLLSLELVISPLSRPSSSSNIGQKHLAPVPNNWGEVVISPRRKKGNNNKQAGVNGAAEGGDIFGVLRVN